MPIPDPRRPYSAGHFEFALDGGPPTAYVKSVEGGFTKAQVINEQIGPDNVQVKHTGPVENEPISVELGLSGCRDAMHWIRDSWQKKPSRRNGAIVHGDFNKQARFAQEFQDALILETGFPALDANSKEPGYLKLKFHPETVHSGPVAGPRLIANIDARQKSWQTSAFRLIIDGVPLSGVSKIDAFTIKQTVTALHSGRRRTPELIPAMLEFPDLSVQMNMGNATAIHAWYLADVVAGANKVGQHTGAIEFLGPDRATPLFTIVLSEVGIKSFALLKSDASSSEIKRCKFELYVGKMDLTDLTVAM